jgi:hypothetical protein
MRSSALTLLALAASLAGIASCSTLDQLPSNVCGNGVVEKGEDCDGAAVGKNNCNATCRVECLADAASPCPPAWGCGRDGLCRQTTGVFQPFGSSLAIAADRLTLADFDGDGRKDLLATRGSSVSIAYADESAIQPQATTVAFAPLDAFADIPGVGDVNGDGRADIAIRLGGGLGVLRGQQSRALSAAAFTRPPAGKLDPGDVLITGDFDPRLEALGDETLALGPTTLRLVHTADAKGMPDKPLLTFASPHGAVAGPLLVDYFVSFLGVALAFEGDSEITLFSPLAQDPMSPGSYAWNYEGALAPPTKIALPPGVKVHGRVFSGRVNTLLSQGYNDLLISGESGGKTDLYVAFHLSNNDLGSPFNSTPQLVPGATADDGAAGLFTRLPYDAATDLHLDQAPLAVTDLNGDSIVDFVGPSGILLSACKSNQQCGLHYEPATPGGNLSAVYYTAATPDSATGWTSAIVGTSSTDPISSKYYRDVITTSADPGFTLYRNEIGVFAPFRFPTQSAVENLVSGDFDGDGARDLAFSQISARSADQSSIHVAFGDALGIPGPALDLGDVGAGPRVVPLRLVGPNTQKDGISDLVVSATSENKPASFLFSGSTDRQIQSPLHLCDNESGGLGVPRYTAIGHFEGAKSRDLAVIYRTGVAPSYGYAIYAIDPGTTISADICSSKIGPGALPEPGGGELTVLPIDVDGDGKDEVLIHAHGSAKLFLAALGADHAWKVTPIDLGEPYLDLTTVNLAARPLLKQGNMASIRDVLLWSTSGVTVLWNDGDGALDPKRAAHATVDMTLCDAAKAGPPTGATAVNLDADGERELVILTATATLYADLSAGSAQRAITGVRCAGDDVVHGGGSVTAGDVDGDGVDDLVIAGPGGIQVFASVPVVK